MDDMRLGSKEVALDQLVVDNDFKERTRKSYSSAMSSFYALVGVTNTQ